MNSWYSISKHFVQMAVLVNQVSVDERRSKMVFLGRTFLEILDAGGLWVEEFLQSDCLIDTCTSE